MEITKSVPDRNQVATYTYDLIQQVTTLTLAPATDTGEVNLDLTNRYTVPKLAGEAPSQYDSQIGRFFVTTQRQAQSEEAFDINYSRTLMDQHSARINFSGTFTDPRPTDPHATVSASGTLNFHVNIDRLIEAGKLMRLAARAEKAPAAQLVSIRASFHAITQLQVLPTSLDIGTIALWFAERLYTLLADNAPIQQFVTETFIIDGPIHRTPLVDVLIRLLNGPFTLSTSGALGAPGVPTQLDANFSLSNGDLSCKATFLVPGIDGTTSVQGGPAVTWNSSVRLTELDELRTIFRAIFRNQVLPQQPVPVPSALVRTAVELWNVLSGNSLNGGQVFNAARALFPTNLPCAVCGTIPNPAQWRDPAKVPDGQWHHLNHLDIHVAATDAMYPPIAGHLHRQDFGYLRAEAKLNATDNSKVRGATLIALPSQDPVINLPLDPSFNHALALLTAWRAFMLAP